MPLDLINSKLLYYKAKDTIMNFKSRLVERMLSVETLRFFWELFTTEYGLESLVGDTLPLHFASSRQLRVLSPQWLESGLIDPRKGGKVPGVPWGLCGPENSGGTFLYDAIQLWKHGLAPNCNSVTFGVPGTRKSTGTKFELFVGALWFLYNQLVIDRTGEYTALVNLINKYRPGTAEVLRFLPDPVTHEPPKVYINPMDPAMDLHEVRFPLISSLILIAMGKVSDEKTGRTYFRNELNIKERTLLWTAIEETNDEYQNGQLKVPLLEHVLQKLFDPTPRMRKAMRREGETIGEWAYDMALALQELTEGRLKGAFHKPTTPGILDPKGLLVLNCQGVKDERVVMTTMIMNYYIISAMQKVGDNARERFHRIILDELWDMLAHPGMFDSVRVIYKQSGKLGIHVRTIMHNEQDAEAVADPENVRALFADSAIREFYYMNRAQVEARASLLGLNEREVDIIAGSKDGSREGLREGTMLLKVGKAPGLVATQRVMRVVRPACDTRWLMREQGDRRSSPLERAQELLPAAA